MVQETGEGLCVGLEEEGQEGQTKGKRLSQQIAKENVYVLVQGGVRVSWSSIIIPIHIIGQDLQYTKAELFSRQGIRYPTAFNMPSGNKVFCCD